MGKYTAPEVTLGDVLQGLVPVMAPLGWRVAIYPPVGAGTTAHASLELVWHKGDSSTLVWRRWGRPVGLRGKDTTMRALLLAVQEAYVALEGRNQAEVMKQAAWELGVPR